MQVVIKNSITLIFAIFILAQLGGCAKTMDAIEHRELDVQGKMSDTIFLDPMLLVENPSVFLRVTNTSNFQEIDMAELIRTDLHNKGFKITGPREAGFIIQANLLYLGEKKTGLTADGMLAGGFGGGLTGAVMGSSSGKAGVYGVAGSLAGAAAGAVVGAMFSVDEYLGAMDIRLMEKLPNGEEMELTNSSDTSNGSAARSTGSMSRRTAHREFRTRIVVNACQTNIDSKEATTLIANRLAGQVSGIF